MSIVKLKCGDKLVAVKTLIDDKHGEYLTKGNIYSVVYVWGDTFTIIDELGKQIVFSSYHTDKNDEWYYLAPLKEHRKDKIDSLEL